jgi:chromosome segregation ATPase
VRSAQQVHNLLVQNRTLTEKGEAARKRADDLGAKNAALARDVTALADEKRAAARRIRDFAREQDALAAKVQQLTTSLRACDAYHTDRHQKMQAQVELLTADRDKLHRQLQEARNIAADTADAAIMSDCIAADAAADAATAAEQAAARCASLMQQLHDLRDERQRLKAEHRRWKTQAQNEAGAASRYRDRNAAVSAENATLAADWEALDTVVQRLRAEQRRLTDENCRWRALARGRSAVRERTEQAGAVASRWLQQKSRPPRGVPRSA